MNSIYIHIYISTYLRNVTSAEHMNTNTQTPIHMVANTHSDITTRLQPDSQSHNSADVCMCFCDIVVFFFFSLLSFFPVCSLLKTNMITQVYYTASALHTYSKNLPKIRFIFSCLYNTTILYTFYVTLICDGICVCAVCGI